MSFAHDIIRSIFRLLLFGLLAVSFLSACLSSDFEIEFEDDGTASTPVVKLNKNVSGLRDLAEACLKADSIAVFNINYNDDGSVLYWLSMKEVGDIELYSEIVSETMRIPELSMNTDGDYFFWTVDGSYLMDPDGNRISVTDLTKPISFLVYEDVIQCRVNDVVVGEYPVTRVVDYLARDVSIDYDLNNSVFSLRLSSGFTTFLPTISDFHLLEVNVPNRSFYKDVFMDAGIALTSRKSLAAADYLGLSLEGISFPYSDATSDDRALQTAIVSGESDDLNGRLLYPDGQPRYRLLFVNGGNSNLHGQSLDRNALKNMRSFVEHGGGYVGTCAGAFFASNGVDGKADNPYYLSVWPGMMQHTGLSKTSSGMFIEENSPLLQYYDFGGDHYVDSIRHNTGGYPVEFPLRTEILARYDYPKKGSVHRKPSIWAYKKNHKSGRVIMEGSHPEEVKDGERRDLTAAMMLYAMDGVGVATLKGYLKNGEARVMDKITSDNNPAYTRIGDLQTHHFATYIPSNARNIQVKVNSHSKCNLALMMNQGTYAFPDVAKYRSQISGANQQLSFPSIPEGFWFIAVQCLTTVKVKETDYGQEYVGNLEVLNGIPYQISITWE